MTKLLTLAGIFILLLTFSWVIIRQNKPAKQDNVPNSDTIHYVSVGDSYTQGLGVREAESWPVLLVNHLQKEGIRIDLVENLAVTGYTAEDVIRYELPEYERLNPQFATLLIGANDVSLGIGEGKFRQNLISIIERMQAKLPRKENFIILTIPDFTNTTGGKVRFGTDGYSDSLKAFNRIIRQEAEEHNLTIVDFENIYTEMSMDQSYFTEDGLHPSARQYLYWEKRIFPEVFPLLKNTASHLHN